MFNLNTFIYNYLKEHGFNADVITDATKLDSFGFDSLDIVDICCELENQTNSTIDLDSAAIDEFKTIADLKNFLETQNINFE